MSRVVSIKESEYLPIVCPVCNHKLEWEGVDLKCVNDNCPNLELSDLQQWCENVGETDGLQWTLMQQYLSIYGVANIDDLYKNKEFILNDLNSKKLSLTEIKIKEFFEKLYINNIDIEKALVGLNVPRLGIKTAKILAPKQDIIYSLLLMSLNQLNLDESEHIRQLLLDLVKEATTETIINNIKKFRILGYTFLDTNFSSSRLLFPKEIDDNEKKFIAVTGALNKMKRKDFETYIAQFGYELTSNLKKCRYLVTNTPDSGSSKNKDAQKYGVEIITEEDFLNQLK